MELQPPRTRLAPPTAPRLLVVSDTLAPDPNGVALIAMRTSELLAERGPVELFGPAGPCTNLATVYTAVRRTAMGTPDFRLPYPSFRALHAAIERSDRVVVHTLGPLGVQALFQSRRMGKPCTLFLHNDFSMLMRHTLGPRTGLAAAEWLAARVERWAVRTATRVIAPRSMAMPRTESFRLDPPRAPLRHADTGGSDGPLVIAYHGRVSREKAVDATVRAIARADPTHSRFRFRIIGDGSQLTPTLRLARELGVPVEHVAWCEEPLASLADAHMYVMASRTETYSMATLEAIGCGVPLIARSVGEIPGYVSHLTSGLLFESDRQLPAMIRALADDPALRCRLASRALMAATDKSVWEQFADAAAAR